MDRAKGLLMTERQMTEQDAYRWMQRMAMDRRASMRTIAGAVIERYAIR